MKIDILETSPSCKSWTKAQMSSWRRVNNIPDYVNAAYDGYTGYKTRNFVLSKTKRGLRDRDITQDLYLFEEKVLQNLKDLRQKPLGYLRALWAMCQNLGTGAPWDTKFLPEFPGRDINGRVQYGVYKGEVVSGNDISNRFYGHVCAYMNIPTKLAQFIAKMDACGALELFSKGKFPTKNLRSFRDTKSDQVAIKQGLDEFEIKSYRLR